MMENDGEGITQEGVIEKPLSIIKKQDKEEMLELKVKGRKVTIIKPSPIQEYLQPKQQKHKNYKDLTYQEYLKKLSEFDRVRIYSNYFPHNNVSSIVKLMDHKHK